MSMKRGELYKKSGFFWGEWNTFIEVILFAKSFYAFFYFYNATSIPRAFPTKVTHKKTFIYYLFLTKLSLLEVEQELFMTINIS